MDQKTLYQKAYEILQKSTPLKFDCGKICNQICCKSNDENSGMYLFPGEEIMYEGLNFPTIIPSGFQTGTDQTVLLALCHGNCERNLRPLACRFFPLTPFITRKGILTVKIDPRAEEICPIARLSDRTQLHPDFVKNARRVAQLLVEDQAIRVFIEKLSAMLDEYTRLPWFDLIKNR
jgi:hypothetical protein